ncbi:hypothetical protein KCP69_01845 [Salmonella enterica subsp. enterica]|nr:hypothetical protein KCP69_01845 [Salmonella enterica subsp. enterica]
MAQYHHSGNHTVLTRLLGIVIWRIVSCISLPDGDSRLIRPTHDNILSAGHHRCKNRLPQSGGRMGWQTGMIECSLCPRGNGRLSSLFIEQRNINGDHWSII